MSTARSRAVVVDTMVVSSIVNAVRQPGLAADYRALIAGRPTLVSFTTVTEMRYGALKAGWASCAGVDSNGISLGSRSSNPMTG